MDPTLINWRQPYQPTGLPDYTGHPFYDPNYSYGGPTDWQNTMYHDIAFNQNPSAGYTSFLSQNNLNGFDARSKAAQGMYGSYARGYGAAQLANPNLYFQDYLGQQDINKQLNNMSYEQLGIDQNRYQNRDRWALRG